MALTRLITLRSLRTRPLRMFLSMFGIVLGVAAILAIGVTNQTALASVARLFEETSGRSDLIITSVDVDEGGFSDQIINRVASVPGVDSAVPSVHVQTVLAEDTGSAGVNLTFFGSEIGGLTLYGIDPSSDQLVRDYTIVEGKFLSPDPDAKEIVLVDLYARENDVVVGKSLEIVTDTGIEKLLVVGLIAKEGAGQLNNGAFGVIPLLTAQKFFFREDTLDQIDLVVSGEYSDGDSLETLRENLQSYLGGEYSVVYPASQGRRMTQMLGSYQIGLNFLSGMALFVGAFLIYNAFSMTVVERTREFGMLRTVGMTRGQVTRQVLLEAIVMGVLGSALGIALGIFMARGLTQLMEVLLGQEMTIVEVPQSIMITALSVGIVVTTLAAMIPAFQAGRISPLEALRVRSRSRAGCLIRFGWIIGTILLAVSAYVLILNPFPYDMQFRFGSMVVVFLFLGGTLLIPVSVGFWEFIMRPFIRVFFGRSGRIGSSNVQRAKLRTTLTVAALMVGVAMIVVVWAMTLSFKGDLDQWLEGYMGGDLYVTSSLPLGRDVWKRIESVEGVASAAPVRYGEVEWISPSGAQETLAYMAVDPPSYNLVTSFIYSKTESSPEESLQKLASGETVFISSVIAEKYGLKPGDRTVLITKLGPREFNISAEVVDYYNQGLVMIGSWSDMGRYFREKDANTYLVKIEEGYNAADVEQRIDTLYGKRDKLVIMSNQSLLNQVSGLMDQAFRMFDVLALIAMMVGFFGILNTLTMNVMERTQELGMLRSVGMTRTQVVFMILAEAAIMGVIGGLLGVLFGIVLSRIFMLAMTAMSGYSLVYTLPMERILVALVIALIVSQIAAFLPAVRGSRIRILEAIQYE